ncbi:uncharacterized protein LOC116848897 [Odontomachus brunneus]|uniref:uncharacterized protein LOC116848897 n=1 Tax=Odontomachus brunneus TaxID=486640 RepID=UPI0013F1D052|nr:uncharacterized protein LOC116848897 [Odontomachus brunneus]
MHTIFAVFVATCSLVAVRSYAVKCNDNNAGVLPTLHKCRGQENLKQCIKDTIESLSPYLANGIRDLDVPRCEPYYIKNYEFIFEKHCNGTVTFKDIFIHGLTNFTINNVESTLDMRHIEFDVYFPHIQVYTWYHIVGVTIHEEFHAPINYQNTVTENFLNVTSHIIINSIYVKNGHNLQYELHYRISMNFNVDNEYRETFHNKSVDWSTAEWVSFLTSLYHGTFSWFRPEMLNKIEADVSNIITENVKRVLRHPIYKYHRYLS